MNQAAWASSFRLHPFDGSGGIYSDFEGCIHASARAYHFRRREYVFEIAIQAANNHSAAGIAQLTPQAQQWPERDARKIANVLQIDDNAVDVGLRHGVLHLLAQLQGGFFALDA